MNEIQDLLNKSEKIKRHYYRTGYFFGLMNITDVIETLERYLKLKKLGSRQSKKYELIKDTITKIYTRLEKEGF